jgi:sulfatase maturation enzyme AslB (radical SAM superfamily)
MSLDMAAVERVRRLAADKPRCEGCFCRWSCAGGCHVNHFFSPGSTRYDDFCVQTRLITACSLLDETDSGKFAAELLEDAPAMRALVLRDSDCLEDWEAAGA